MIAKTTRETYRRQDRPNRSRKRSSGLIGRFAAGRRGLPAGLRGRRFSGPDAWRRETFRPVTSGRLLAERVLPIAILAVAAISVPILIVSPSGLRRLDGLRQERTRAEHEISASARRSSSSAPRFTA